MTDIAIMLGGNLPETPDAFDKALSALAAGGVVIRAVSEAFASPAEDCVPGTPDFLDMALIGEWDKSPLELLHLTRSIEVALGRPACHSSRESRIIDLDIILFGDEVISTPELTVPHPRAAQREFVLRPLAGIAPNWKFPDCGMEVEKLLHDLLSRA